MNMKRRVFLVLGPVVTILMSLAPVHAGTIQASFDINVSAKRYEIDNSFDPTFVPFTTHASITIDPSSIQVWNPNLQVFDLFGVQPLPITPITDPLLYPPNDPVFGGSSLGSISNLQGCNPAPCTYMRLGQQVSATQGQYFYWYGFAIDLYLYGFDYTSLSVPASQTDMLSVLSEFALHQKDPSYNYSGSFFEFSRKQDENNNGAIVDGYAYIGYNFSVNITDVQSTPEPASYLLALSGFALIVALGVRPKRNCSSLTKGQ